MLYLLRVEFYRKSDISISCIIYDTRRVFIMQYIWIRGFRLSGYSCWGTTFWWTTFQQRPYPNYTLSFIRKQNRRYQLCAWNEKSGETKTLAKQREDNNKKKGYTQHTNNPKLSTMNPTLNRWWTHVLRMVKQQLLYEGTRHITLV